MEELVKFEDGDDLSTSPRRGARENLFCWTVFILFLVLLAAFCWLGSYYIFGYPEKPLSYEALRKLKKLENIQKFELTTAPRGEFLNPKTLFQRYGMMSPKVLEDTNARLLRNFIRNYRETRDLVPYVIGTYTILDSFGLGAHNLFTSGVVALAQSIDVSGVLLESVFTARQQVVPLLQKTLLTGLHIRLEKRFDLSALIHIEYIGDGRILFTTLPILYGSYSSYHGPESFSLSPPDFLNVKAGLPILSKEEIEVARRSYYLCRRQSELKARPAQSQSLRKGDAPPRTLSDTTGPSKIGQLIRIERPALLLKKTTNLSPESCSRRPLTSLQNIQSKKARTPFPIFATKVARAVPVQARAALSIPVKFARSPKEIASSVSSTQSEDYSLISSSVSHTSLPATHPVTTPLTSLPTGSWQTYKAGQMPLGKLVEISEIQQLMQHRLWNKRVYLMGSFRVTASRLNQAVLRPQGFRPPFFLKRLDKKVRVVVEFPSHSSAPKLGVSLHRGRRRPFLIIDIQRSLVGTTDVFAKEITHD
ncbi:MAG: hypothetical protein JMM78_01090 [Candidatus Xiphinematobacter sp.]|nr:MAG: hypothetical protein JMM78_01090 [Candidatus Xiphinematobacter sp.]